MEADNSTVFLLDDDPGVREALSMLLQSVGLKCRVFATPSEFLREYDGSEPGCLILDVRMPEMSGMAVQQALAERGIRVPIIFLSGHGDVPMAVRAMRAGAFDFHEKPIHDQLLLDSVHAALRLDADWRQEAVVKSSVNQRLSRLTPRERAILNLMCEGLTSREIAERLSLSSRTVEGYRHRIHIKMEAQSVAELVGMIGR